MPVPLVSVIIPTRNEAQVIAKNLQAIKNQTYPSCEVIVVDDGSTDATAEIARKFTKFVYLRSHAERSVQRNFGAKKSKGEYLLFLDADMQATPSAITDCVNLITANSAIGAIAIPEQPVAVNYWEKVKAFERSFYSDFGDPDTDAARFFSKKLFEKAGGYDETITGPEDWDLPETIVKMGYQIGRVSSRINHYERIPSLSKLIKKKYYYGLSSHRYFKKHRLPIVGPKTIYFLRPIFYKNWRRLVSSPALTAGMFIVLTLEQLFGGLGYLVGKIKQA
ncbi:MAG: beta-1,3-galactosyltransferase [Microgenomates group bacterium Gr01-1014_16]|nr:MAG: beta-1,3-galactosyltransferase [Microgenomates group bacterium Gr01-1014_16]